MTGPKATLLNDTSTFHHHGCHVVVEQIRQHCKEHGIKLWHTVKLGDDWRAERHRRRVVESNVVIVNGEGTLHHDRKSAIALVESASFCRQRNIPCCLINSVYQENGSEMASLVRQFNLVFVRESRSKQELRNEGIDSEVVPDMTLSHPDLPRATRKGIIVTDSSSKTAAVQLHGLYKRTEGAELASLFTPASTSQALRKLVSRAIGKRTSKRWGFEWDRFGKLRCPLFDAAPLEPITKLLSRVSSTRLIVTGRFHMVCLAMLARTPFIALEGNTHKIEGLLADASLWDRFHTSPPDIRDLAAWSEWHDGELALIEAYLQKARFGISQMFTQIRQLAVD